VYFPVLKLGIAFLDPTEEKDMKPEQGYWNVGFDRMGNVIPGDQTPEEMAAIFDKHAKGSLIAYDPLTGETVWEKPDTAPIYGGTLSTAGGLVFYGANLNEFIASDAKTGENLWKQETGATVMAAPMTYALDGEQYIAVAAGFGGGASAEAGPVFHALDVPRRNRVLVYKLGADTELPEPVENKREMPKPAPVTASADVIKHGQALFQRHCSYCHGDELRTAGVNPDLRWSSEDVHERWQSIVRGGALKTLGMVNFDKYLTEEDAEAIRQYVLSEANRLYAYKHKQNSAASGE
jgi:quinohemoprotein ethanol dehydrogenase